MTATVDQHDFITGLVAAFIAAICFGSYGVPMKGEAATRVDVDPLVFQSYKAFTVFVSVAVILFTSPLHPILLFGYSKGCNPICPLMTLCFFACHV